MIETKLATSSALAAGLVACSLACGDGVTPSDHVKPSEHAAASDDGARAPAFASSVAEQGAQAAQLQQLSQAIVGGETDREHLAVLAITLVTRREVALCSGSLIAPNLVLTARHCVSVTDGEKVDCSASEFGRLYSPEELWVSSSTTVGASSFYPVREVLVPDDGSELCGADIALMILDGQFRTSSIEPIAPRLNEPARRGESFTAVGFGDALSDGEAGVRRALDGLEVVCGPDDCNSPNFLTQREFVGEQGVCDGDSGGPALDAEGRVVGVASRATEDCGLAVYSAISPWRDWILDVAGQAYDQGRYDEPEWLAEPGALIASQGSVSTPEATSSSTGSSSAQPGARIAPTETARQEDSGCSLLRVGSEPRNPGGARTASSTAYALLALAGAVALRRPRRRR